MYVILALVVLLVLLVAALFFLGAHALMGRQEDRKRRAMADRLAAVAAQAEETHRQRKERAESGAALTALLPAIKQAKEGPRRVA